MKTFIRISLLFLPILIISCKEDSSTGTLSAVAQITSFAFTANDSFPGLAEAQFVVEELSDTGLIRMRKNDSVRFGTPIDSIIPKISYYTTPSSVTFYLGDSAVSLTGYDTLDLRIKPIKIHVVAQNKDYSKWYKLEFDIHTVDGDLFHWDTVRASIPNANTHGQQRAIVRLNRFYYYQNDGYGVTLFTSDNAGENWSQQSVTGLPADCNVRQIIESEELFFYGKGHTIYYSNNGYDWNQASTQLEIIALYMCMNVNNIHDQNDNIRLWMAAKDSVGIMRFYTVGRDLLPHVEQNIGLTGDSLPLNFPIEEYATIPFQSSSLHEHALIAGGYDRTGKMTAARWSLEYNYVYNTYHLTNMSGSNDTFTPFAGSSASYYGQYLYLLGGIHEDRTFLNNTYGSADEGVHFVEITDTLNSKRPKDLKGRYHTNTFVHDLNLYIIGGEDNSTTYSDVYRGRMNSIAWPEIGD